MATDIELVIKMSKESYKNIREQVDKRDYPDMQIGRAIANGTLLPKGHGDLIDRSKIYKAIPAEEDNCTGAGMTLEEMDAYNEGIDAMYSFVKGAPTIIEAERSNDE